MGVAAGDSARRRAALFEKGAVHRAATPDRATSEVRILVKRLQSRHVKLLTSYPEKGSSTYENNWNFI
jgi:hypothetical protein